MLPLSKDLKLQKSFFLIRFFKVAASTQEREKPARDHLTKTSHVDNHSPTPHPPSYTLLFSLQVLTAQGLRFAKTTASNS